MRDVAGAVAEDLHLDVARARDQLLHVELVAAERGARLRAQRANVCSISSAVVTTRVPRPPPPASALMIIAAVRPERGEERLRLVERDGVVETADHRHVDAAAAACRARALSPNSSRCFTCGPTKVSPASAQAAAKSPRSARKP